VLDGKFEAAASIKEEDTMKRDAGYGRKPETQAAAPRAATAATFRAVAVV